MPGSRRPGRPCRRGRRRDLVEEGQTVLTLEFKLNLLRPALCQRLLCRAEVLKAGRQVTVVEAEVFAERDGRRHLFSKATVTMAVVALAE